MGSVIKPYSESTHFSTPWCIPYPRSPELVWSHFLLSQTFQKFPSSSGKKAEVPQGPLPWQNLSQAPPLPSFLSPPTSPASSLFLKHFRLTLPQGICTCCLPCSLLSRVYAEHFLPPI